MLRFMDYASATVVTFASRWVNMKPFRLLAVLLCLFSLPSTAGSSSPADLAQRYNTLFYGQDYKNAFALYDTSELKIARLLAAKTFTGASSEALKAMVFGKRSESDIAALSDAAYLELFYSAMIKGGRSDDANITATNVEVLGTVYDGSDIAYVACKNTLRVNDKTLQVVELVRLKKMNGAWFVGMPSEIVGMNAAVEDLTDQSIEDFLTENREQTDGDVQILDAIPPDAVVIGEIEVEFASEQKDYSARAAQELKRRAYVEAAHAIAEIETEDEIIDGIYFVKARAKTLVFKKR